MRAGILGMGEVGSAIYEIVGERALVSDPKLGMLDNLNDADLIHVCVRAEDIDKALAPIKKDKILIIHSTVPIGTCEKLANEERIIFHCPISGRHPNLTEYIRKAPLYLSFGNTQICNIMETLNYFTEIGLQTILVGEYVNTELAKLLCTLRLGWDVLFLQEVARLCNKFDANFEIVYKEWTELYNKVYEDTQFQRPILEFYPLPIGGHCVLPNAKLLRKDSWIAREVLKRGSVNE